MRKQRSISTAHSVGKVLEGAESGDIGRRVVLTFLV